LDFKMNKKGFLLAEETLKIVLAVISIGFLVYFLYALYFANQGNEELEQAEASLEYLIEQINFGSETVEIYNPEDDLLTFWQIAFFDSSREYIPESCKSQKWDSCVCICGPSSLSKDEESAVKTCDTNGACGELSDIYNVNTEDIDFIDKIIVGYEYSIPLDNLPMTLEINYDKKIIKRK